jgi:hypothetical protein
MILCWELFPNHTPQQKECIIDLSPSRAGAGLVWLFVSAARPRRSSLELCGSAQQLLCQHPTNQSRHSSVFCKASVNGWFRPTQIMVGQQQPPFHSSRHRPAVITRVLELIERQTSTTTQLLHSIRVNPARKKVACTIWHSRHVRATRLTSHRSCAGAPCTGALRRQVQVNCE